MTTCFGADLSAMQLEDHKMIKCKWHARSVFGSFPLLPRINLYWFTVSSFESFLLIFYARRESVANLLYWFSTASHVELKSVALRRRLCTQLLRAEIVRSIYWKIIHIYRKSRRNWRCCGNQNQNQFWAFSAFLVVSSRVRYFHFLPVQIWRERERSNQILAMSAVTRILRLSSTLRQWQHLDFFASAMVISFHWPTPLLSLLLLLWYVVI